VSENDMPAWLAVSVRFAIVGELAQIVVAYRKIRPPARRWIERVLLGLTHAFAMGLVYIAQRTESSGIAACVMASTPLFIAVLSARGVLGEPLTRHTSARPSSDSWVSESSSRTTSMHRGTPWVSPYP
jgi:drug/metabolite transporter (DMT)-like permease